MRSHPNVFISLMIIFSLLPMDLPAADQPPSAVISMDFQDASLRDILKIFSIQSGLNFIASEGVQDRKVTLFLDKVPLKEAMDKLFIANNLTYELDENAKIFVVKDWGKMPIETVTRVFNLKYATVSSSSLIQEVSTYIGGGGSAGSSAEGELGAAGGGGSARTIGLTEAIKKNLSSAGSVIEDFRTNSLIVMDIPSRLPVIEKLIASLDVASPQIMLEVEMLDVSKNLIDRMGFDLGANPFTVILPGTRPGSKFFLGDVALRGARDISSSTAGAVVLGRTFANTLDFLRTRTDTKFLARPRLLTLNNETAEIKITTKESIGIETTTEATSGTTQSQPEREETGVLLRITPQANIETGEITMFIYPEVSEATQGNVLTSDGQSFQFRDPETRSTKSVVRVRDNQTVLLGGLIRNEFSQDVSKIPILGDIPLAGFVFRHKDKSKDRERELIVFITPRIVKENGLGFYQTSAPEIKEERIAMAPPERMSAIESSLNSFEKIK
ncbi:MAG: secretin N-terminal domain-containing protein [Candidatus Omnitrophica bacterium]|nr:secretin N-terminal domain-containing protein [Candidatus Omnitrophota bacterium]